MQQQISKLTGAYYVIDGYNKGTFKIVNSRDLTDYKDFIHNSSMTIRDQASQYLNSIGLMVIGIVDYQPTMCLMIVNEN